LGLDTGHRSMLAEAWLDVVTTLTPARRDSACRRHARTIGSPGRARATRT
jgi:hypothetical protein